MVEKKEARERRIRLPRLTKKKDEMKATAAMAEKPTLNKDPYDILKFVLMTEKAVRMIEAQNKLVFIVDRRSGKNEVKAAVQLAFNSNIADVETMIDQNGRKKAFVKFAKPGEAGEIAIRLGII